MDRVPPRRQRPRQGFPRRRGDGPSGAMGLTETGWFPPQARGWTRLGTGEASGATVSPAGAGMDPTAASAVLASAGFPRRRGDGPLSEIVSLTLRAFPPQARGWTEVRVRAELRHRVSPAGAGMDPLGFVAGSGLRRFPRRRGDGPVGYGALRQVETFPPQARGWTCDASHYSTLQTVSPAGAGMDRSPSPTTRSASRFPRRRGDGPRR